MILTIVAATELEIQPLTNWLQENYEETAPLFYKKDGMHIQILITGVGMTLTALNLGFYFAKQQPDLAINAGIAGAFDKKRPIGSVLNVISERFGDLGAETDQGDFIDVHEVGLIGEDAAPFENGEIINPKASDYSFLPVSKGLTVNKVHGSSKSIDLIKSKYTCDLETMEGAAFFLACRLAGVDFLQIRAVSNYVEPRNKENWDIPLAINKLNEILIEMITAFEDGAKK